MRSKRKTIIAAIVVTVTMSTSTVRTTEAHDLPNGIGGHRFKLDSRDRLP
jgi:hypothetical protein